MQTGTINDITNLKFFSDKGNEIPMYKKYILTWEFIPGKLAQNYMQANLSGYFIGDVDLSNPSNIQIAKNSLMTSILEKGSIFVRLSTTAMTDENKMRVFSYAEIDNIDNSVFYDYIKKILMDTNNKVKVSININDQSFTHTYAFKQVFTLNNITENFEDYFTITKIYTGNNTEGAEQEYYILLNINKIDLVPLKKDPATSFIQQVFENNVSNIGLYFPFFRYYGDFYQDKVSSKFIAANTILVLEEQYSNDNNTTYNKPYISSNNQYSLVFQPELQSELKIISNDSVYNIEYKSEAAFSLADAEVSTTYVTPFSFSIGFCAETEGAYQNLLGIYVRSLDNTDIAFFAGVISIKSEVEAEDERFRTLLGNFGIPDPISYSNLFAKQDFAEEGLDYKLINEKSKELFINYSDIFSYVGTYKALINAVKYLGYYDIVFKEWYTLLDINDHETDIAVQAYDTNTGEYLKSKLAQYGVSIEDFQRYNKINKLSMIYHLNEEIDTYEYIDQTWTIFEDGKYKPEFKYTKLSEVPLTRPIYEYRNEEILAKLLSVKNWLEENIIGVGAYISDITGEGVYFGWQKTQAYHTQHDLYDFSNNQYYTPNYKEVQKFTNSSTTISCTLNELNNALTFDNYEHTPIEVFTRFDVSLNLEDSTGIKSDIDNIIISNSIESPVLGDEYEFEVSVTPQTGTLYEWCKNSATQIYVNDGEINLLFDGYYEANIDADKLPIITLENANIHKCYGKWQENIKWGIREVIDQETGNTNYKLVNFKLYDKINYEIYNNQYLILYPTSNDAYIKYTQHNKWDIPLFIIKGYKFLNYIPNAEYINEFDLTDGEYILEIIKGDVLFKQEGNVSAQLSFSLDNENKLSEQEINVHYKYQSPKMPFTYIDYVNIQNTIDNSIFDYRADIDNTAKYNNASIYWDSLLYDISTKIKTNYTNVAYNEASAYINSTVKSEYDTYINMLNEQIVKEKLYNDYVNIYSDNYTFNQYIDVSVNRLGNYSILTKAYDKYNNIYTSEYDKLVNVTTTPIQYNIITPYDYSNNSSNFHNNNAYGRKLEESEIDTLIIDVSKNTPEYPANYKIYDFEYNSEDNSVEFDNISYAIDTPKNNDYIVFENCSERCDHIEVNETNNTTTIYMFDENPNQNNIYNDGVSVSVVVYDKLHNKDAVCVGPYEVVEYSAMDSSNDINYTADSYIVIDKNLSGIIDYFNNPRYTAYVLNTTEYELSNINTSTNLANNSTIFTLGSKAFNIEDVVKLRYYDNNNIINETAYRITNITENIDPSTYLVNDYTFEINGLININVIYQYEFNSEIQKYELIDSSNKYKTVITYAHGYPVHYFAQIIGNAVERNRNIGYDGWSIINTKFNYNSTKLFLDDYIDDTYSGYIYKYDPYNLKRMWLNLYNTIDNTADLYEYKMPTTIKQGDVIILSSNDDKNIFLPGYVSTWTWKTDTLDDNDNIIDYKKNNSKTTVFKSINNILTVKPYLLGSQDIELSCVDIYGNRVINEGSGALYVNKNNYSPSPIGCSIITVPYSPYLTFTAKADGSSVGLEKLSTNQMLEYSTDTTIWNTFDITTDIYLNNGDKVYVRGILSGDNTIEDFTQFKMTGKISINGAINAIWNYTNLEAQLKEYCGCNMFLNCSSLINTPELPSKTLSTGCYRGMFTHCTSLTNIPKLPAKVLTNECYTAMFSECTSLTTAPELPATTLAGWCYKDMFAGCTSLITAPELPATTLADYCYCQMFYNCTSLVEAPKLPAMKLADSCYYGMFVYCTSLTTTPELPALILAKKCYVAMFHGCSSLITSMEILPATDLLETNWTKAGFGNSNSNYSGINDSRVINEGVYTSMFWDCTSLTTAPILPAKHLSPGCYNSMFHNCKKLTKVIILAENLHVNISDESFNTVVELANDYNGQADRDWMELNAAVCWIDHSGNVTTRKFYVPESAINDWNAQTTYFTHVFADNMEIISQEEIDNIIEQYNIQYAN